MPNFKLMQHFLRQLGLKKTFLQHFTAYKQFETRLPDNLESLNLACSQNTSYRSSMQNFKSMLQLLRQLDMTKAFLQYFTAYQQHKTRLPDNLEP